ncbi:hypothetical protein EJ08DRAFT_654074 [Tothia fuscella]|uniref:Uncharacterized protein n=1 Tax=Tothia fuscella TaxID=1048955 RepID=A0A9P4NFM0_9PEZI|nr:hypothetical protein EJ08DRAFT_654074 [Tothia fuscella]
MTASNGMLNSAGAAALGLGFGGTGGTAKLSRERKHRMRELATQKLSQAYHFDEIAASVATMQSASTLEDLAQFVLQRNPTDFEARYVHFFHEKIPSRMMAECTPLDPLNQLISERPNDGSPYRTRALTRIFKEDFTGAAKDLTEGLSVARWQLSQHRAGKDQLVLAKTIREEAQQKVGKDWRSDIKIEEEDQPSSLETQMLFHRANVHFTIAVSHVQTALDAYKDEQAAKTNGASPTTNDVNSGTSTPVEDQPRSSAERDGHRKHLEYRKLVKTNAKKALRDYNAFLGRFDYTPGLDPDIAEEFLRRFNNAAKVETKTKVSRSGNRKQTVGTVSFDSDSTEDIPLDPTSGALIPAKKQQLPDDTTNGTWPSLPPTEIYPASQLFSEKVPANIPPYPSPSNALALRTGPTSAQTSSSAAAAAAFSDSHEAVTYHPLLTDALHSLLLCHALLQTSATELKRHAHNAARLARICDGYPIFLAARSPARADWVEVLRRAHNWVGLNQSWEVLCRPAPLPGHSTQGLGDRGWNLGREPDTPVAAAAAAAVATTTNGNTVDQAAVTKKVAEETEKQKQERRKHAAILEALADERVVDEESFQAAVRAREKRAIEDEEAEEAAAKGFPPPSSLKPKPYDSPKPSSSPEPEPEPTPEIVEEGELPATTAGAEKSGDDPKPAKATKKAKKKTKSPALKDDDYPISTERAEAISRWVREAPISVEGASKGKKGAKKPKGKRSGLVEEID